jgi:hypothetical protein
MHSHYGFHSEIAQDRQAAPHQTQFAALRLR